MPQHRQVRSRVVHPEWSREACIYQLNTRQLTPEGTLAAAAGHLPRLRDLGVTVVWLMPVHPIGEVGRKGRLGSPYAVRDHREVSPELGTTADLVAFVEQAHALGLRVLLDWVGNHTAWDHPLTVEHPEWYDRDPEGRLRSTPWWDWDDVVDLDYGRPGLRRYMLDAMLHWVRAADVDGFRCDAAGFVPTDFWVQARQELSAVKPVYLLAEWESRELHDEAFDASYAWGWNEALHRIARGQADVTALHVFYSWTQKAWPPGSQRMTFVSNHDKNAWEGTEYEQFGDALANAVVLSVVGEGVPLLYTGQEAGNTRRLAFFDRDPVTWRDHPMAATYRRLFALKRSNAALWNAPWGAAMEEVPVAERSRVLAFARRHERGDAVLAVLNLSPEPCTVTLGGTAWHGAWRNAWTGAAVELDGTVSLQPWRHLLLERGAA